MRKTEGFSVIELLVALIVLLILLTGSFTLFARTIRANRSELRVSDKDQLVKNALLLLSTEIEQAGSNPDPKGGLPLTTGLLSAGTSVIAVDRTEGLNIGNTVVVDPFNNDPNLIQEVKIVSVTRTNDDPDQPGTITVNPPISGAHNLGVPILARNLPYKGGILYAPPGPSRPAWSSDGETLRIFGDLNDQGALYLSEYKYVQDAPGRGRLVRASELITGKALPGAPAAFKVPFTLLEGVVPNPDGTPIFRYVRDDQNHIAAVMITLTVQALGNDTPASHTPRSTFRVTVSSRNVAGASQLSRSFDSNAAKLPAVPNYILDLAKWPAP